MPTITLMIGGMTCRHCVRDVTSRLRDVAGVDTMTADAGTSVVRLSGTMTVDDVLGALSVLSYSVQLLDETAGAAATAETAGTAETAKN
jgi:copper chaperone CopZ